MTAMTLSLKPTRWSCAPAASFFSLCPTAVQGNGSLITAERSDCGRLSPTPPPSSCHGDDCRTAVHMTNHRPPDPKSVGVLNPHYAFCWDLAKGRRSVLSSPWSSLITIVTNTIAMFFSGG